MPIPASLQELEPRQAHLCLDIERFITKDLNLSLTACRILIALSAGVDSMALLLFCHILKRRLGLEIQAVHLNHHLRQPAEREAEFVKDTCNQLNIRCHIGSSHIRVYADKYRLGLEEAARIIRYRFLFGVRKKVRADYLLTAHHLNDLAEDILLRQIRGTGWPALGGMAAYVPESSLLRPFLLTPKEELQKLVSQANMTWFEDDSNQDQKFRRNRIRHNIMPLLIDENPNFLEQIKKIWQQARTDDNYWQGLINGLQKIESWQEGTIHLKNKDLWTLHQAVRLRWYRSILDRLGPGQARAEALYLLDRTWSQSKTGKRIQFPGNKVGLIEGGGLCFFRANG